MNNTNLYHGYKIAIKFRRAEILFPFVLIIVDYFQSVLDEIGSFSYVRRNTFAASLSLSLALLVSLPFFLYFYIDLTLVEIRGLVSDHKLYVYLSSRDRDLSRLSP